MARKTPQTRTRPAQDDDTGHSFTNISSDDSVEDDDEDEEGDEDDDGDDEDRGDDHDPDDGDEDDDDDDGGEEEGDEDDEDDDDGEEEEDADTLREIAGDGTVPHGVVGELRRQNRELQAALLARGGGAPAQDTTQAPAFDVKAKRREAREKLLEGDIDAANAIDDEIDAYHQQQAAAQAQQAALQVIERSRVDEAIAEVQRRYPVLNDAKRKSFNQDTLDEVCALRDVLLKRGKPFGAALREAAKRVCERGSARDDDEREDRRPKNRNQLSLREKRDRIRRASGIPPQLSRHGSGGRAIKGAGGDLSEDQIRNMSEAKFKNIDPKDKARARGDFVEEKPSRRR